MTLQKQPITILLGQGVDQKKDKKTLSTGFSELTNAYLLKENRLDKRFGSTKLSDKSSFFRPPVRLGRALATYEDELLQQSNNTLQSYSAAQSLWMDRGAAYSVAVTSQQIIQKTTTITQVDSAENELAILYAYHGPDGILRWTLVDRLTGSIIRSDVQQDTSSKNIRCIAFASYFYIFYIKGTSLICAQIDVQTGFVLQDENIATDITAAGIYDVIDFKSRRMAVFYNRAADLRVLFLDDELTILSGPLAPYTIAETASVLTLAETGNDTISFGWFNNISGTRAALVNQGGTYIKVPFTVDADIVEVMAITIVGQQYVDFNDGTNDSMIWCFYEKTAASASNHFVKRANWRYGTGPVAVVFLRSVGLQSKAFLYDGNSPYEADVLVGITHSSPLQSTSFVANKFGTIVSKHQPGTAGGLCVLNHVSSVTRIGEIFSWAMLNKVKLNSENGNVFTNLGVLHTQIDFRSNSIFNAVELGKNLHIVGGVLSMYDGISVVESGFHLFPEALSATQSGGTIPNGNYLYVAHYEWIDARGQVHRSAPSVPLAFEVTAGPGNVAVKVPTLRLTQKRADLDRSPVSIVLSRTADGDSGVFYRVSSISSPTLNDPSLDEVTITDTLPDSSIFSNEILYTSGGVLENAAPPACTKLTIWGNRLVLAGLEIPTAYVYSKVWTDGGPVEFAPGFGASVDSQGGGITAIEVVNDKLWIAKYDRYYVSYGEGPNDLGLGAFVGPEAIASDVGCVNQETVARAPFGLFFKSSKGFYLLDGNLGASPIGLQVEDFNSLETTSAVLLADNNQVRFTHSVGPCLVYDYLFQQWTTFDYYDAFDAIVWKNQYVLLRSDAGVYIESKDKWRDNGRSIQISFTTGWLTFAGINGFQRIYAFQFIGEYLSAHKLRVSVGYDNSNTWHDTYIFDAESEFPAVPYGDEIYGVATPYGGNANAYTVEGKLSRQKCQSIRFKVEDLTPSAASGSGQSLSMTAFSLLIGLKKGFAKLPVSQTIGSTG